MSKSGNSRSLNDLQQTKESLEIKICESAGIKTNSTSPSKQFRTFLDSKISEANGTDTSLQSFDPSLSSAGSDAISIAEVVSPSVTSPLEINMNLLSTTPGSGDMETEMEISNSQLPPTRTWTMPRINEITDLEKACSSDREIVNGFLGTGGRSSAFSNGGMRGQKRKSKYNTEFERMYGHGRMKRGKTLRV